LTEKGQRQDDSTMQKPKWIQNEAQILQTDSGAQIYCAFESSEEQKHTLKITISGSVSFDLLTAVAMVNHIQNAIGECYATAWKNQGRT
jgi:hypothetical protein